MRIEVVVPVIPSFLEPPRKSAAERRRELRAQRREFRTWSEAPGGHSEQDWRDLKRRQDHKCFHCGRGERKLYRSRKVPTDKGGTNNIGNILALCEDCKNWRRGRCYSQLRYLIQVTETRRQKQGGWKTAGRSRAARRHRRFIALAIQRGFLRESGERYLASDSDTCVCKKGQDPHLLGSEVCKRRAS